MWIRWRCIIQNRKSVSEGVKKRIILDSSKVKRNDIFQRAICVLWTSLVLMVNVTDGHGRLRDPPSRSSAWRDGFNIPPDYNDTEGFCGGYERQWLVNEGRCGICGDPFDEIVKPHEAPGGVFATGTIVRNYTEGQIIPVKIDITALHKGFYTFQLCPNNNINQDPTQECLDRFPLKFINDGDSFFKYDVSNLVTGILEARLQLPSGVTCAQCILQWEYVTGNRWGTCSNGTKNLGCGPQESFRACSDIGIYPRDMESTTSHKPIINSASVAALLTSTTVFPTKPLVTIESTSVTVIPTAKPTWVPTKMLSTEMPSTILPTPNPSFNYTCSSYKPAPSHEIVDGMTDWCIVNCTHGYCPSIYCICIP